MYTFVQSFRFASVGAIRPYPSRYRAANFQRLVARAGRKFFEQQRQGVSTLLRIPLANVWTTKLLLRLDYNLHACGAAVRNYHWFDRWRYNRRVLVDFAVV
jgi:hypothetical protein